MTSLQFDTNILLYSISRDPTETTKHDRAVAIIDAGDNALSVQVLQEFYVQATHDRRTDRLTHGQAAGLVESFCRFPVQDTTVGLALAATNAAHRLQIPYWDAAILEAARLLECEVVLSEDLPHGRSSFDILVVDPFSGY
jgi:predicted nucleic acid-binding protein